MNPLEREREEQTRWRPLNPGRVEKAVDRLIEREFLLPTVARDLENRELANILDYARQAIPFYASQKVFQKFGRIASSVPRERLLDLPVLTKQQLIEHHDRLQPRQAPKGHEPGFRVKSTGTTGTPARVVFSRPAALMFAFFLQRQLRWERVDPNWKQAVIRLQRNIPTLPNGQLLQDGETWRGARWNHIERWFHTGPAVAFNRSNPIEEQLAWVRAERPNILVSFPGNLESLSHAAQGLPVDSLKSLRAISATLTEGMRRRIREATGLDVSQNYGLNEIGLAAIRCRHGAYHVNAEHCVAEVLASDGSPCGNGETGRLVMTGLTNYAMPLLRYDTGDLAVARNDPCPCGRTLPTFGRIIGRYRPMNSTPDGTAQRLDHLTAVIDELPHTWFEGIAAYQIHQDRADHWQVRVQSGQVPDPRLVSALETAWNERFADTPFAIVKVDAIPPAPGGKQQEFHSEFFPASDEDQ